MTKKTDATVDEEPSDDRLSSKRSPAEIEANERILQAGAEKALIEVDAARLNLEIVRANVQKMGVETEFGRANIALITEQMKAQEVTTRATLRMEQEALANALYHHIYHFTTAVDGRSTRECMARLDIWHNIDPKCDIEIIFSSPGGSVIDGMALFDYITQLRSSGHFITTSTIGYAASMAGILLQAGDKRLMGREAYILIHEISAGAVGKIGELEDEMAFLKKMGGRVLDIFASRSTMSRAQIDKHWKRKDWWIDSDEALKYGFVDEVR